MNDRWLTGREVLENYGLQVFELASLLEGGLPAYEPGTGNRYISPKDCKKIGDVFSDSELRERYEPAFRKIVSSGFEGAGLSMEDADLYSKQVEKCLTGIAERPYPPEKHTILDFQIRTKSTEYDACLATILDAQFLRDDVEEALAQLVGGPPPSERIADLERQLAEARQENEALTVEVERLRAEVGEAEGLAEVGSGNISDKQAEALKVFLMRREGKTVKEVGESLFSEVYGPNAQAQRVYRAQKIAKAMLVRGDKPAA